MSGRQTDGAEPTGSLERRDVLKGIAGAGAFAGAVSQADRGGASGDDSPERYVVGIDPDSTAAVSAASAATSKALSVHRELDLGSVRTVVSGWYTPEKRAELREHPAVAYVEREQFFEPHSGSPDSTSDSQGQYPWGIERIGANVAHADGYTGAGVDVVIVDTGIAPSHPALQSNVETGSAFGDADCTEADRSFETVTCDQPWDDDHFHGTHVAGTAAATDADIDPSADVERIAGVAPAATLHAANVFEWVEQGSEWVLLAPSANTADAIRWAADQGYDVVNASLGGPNSTTAIKDALAYATDQHNVVFVASAGNDGNACSQDPFNDDPDDCVSYPAALDDAIAVANTTEGDGIASSSSRGPEVEVAAPGSGVLSAATEQVEAEVGYVDIPYWKLTGTSMAAPHVTGLVALIKAHTSMEDNAKIRTHLRNTAEDIGARDVESGSGLIDVQSALDGPAESPSVSTLTPSSVDQTTALLEGDLVDLGDASEADVFFEYWIDGSDSRQQTSVTTRTSAGTWESSVSGLDTGTTYRYRAMAETDTESASGDEQTFTTAESPLAVDTGDAMTVGQNGATLQGTLQELGGADSGEVFFEYWEDGATDRLETARSSRQSTGEFEAEVTELAAGTTYRYRAMAETDTESASGNEQTFTTEAPPLAVATGDVAEVGQTEATLRGELLETGGSEAVDVTVEYWADGSSERAETASETLAAPGTFEFVVADLDPETTYRYRALAETESASASGDEQTFTTEAPPLAVDTGGATAVGRREATLSGTVTEFGAADQAEVYFEYGPQGDDSPAETDREVVAEPGAFEQQVSGLDPGTTYTFRAAAETTEESDTGPEQSFTTEHLPLTVETGTTRDVTETTATLTGELTELGAADSATVFFEYGSQNSEERRETPPRLYAEPGAVEEPLTELLQDTTYTYRARAKSEQESAGGATESFRTAVVPVSRPTVDTTAASNATFSQRGEGYRIRAAGRGPWYRPRNEHGYGAIYTEIAGDVVAQTTIDGLHGDSDTRMAGLVVSRDLSAGGGVAGDLLLLYEPEAGISLATYDDEEWEYVTAATAAPVEYPCDLRLSKRGSTFVAEFRHASDAAWESLGSVTVPAADSQQIGLFATGGQDSSRCVADFAEFRIGETGVSLLPATRTIQPQREASLELVVENARKGIRSYSVTLDSTDPDLLTIEGVTLTGEPASRSIDVWADGSRAEIEAGMGADAHEDGDVTIADVAVRTHGEGTASITLAETIVVDDDGATPYAVADVNGSTVTVTQEVGPPPVVGADPPRDLDGDGLYRDVDGDGSFTISDVRALLRHRHDDAVLNNAQYFNFDGGSPPEVSLLDVQALFADLIEAEREGSTDRSTDVDLSADTLRSLLE